VEWATWISIEVLPLVPLTMLVGCCAMGLGGYAGRLLQLPPLTALGRISYGVYLFHPIVLSLAVKAQPWIPVNVSEQGPGRFLVAGAGTLILAAISWSVFEKRLNLLKRHFPYIAPRNDSPAASFAHAGDPDYRVEGARGHRSTIHARDNPGRDNAFQTSDVQ
jgi:peptidoglycan/LPS O-acetylase OafA/YrhL